MWRPGGAADVDRDGYGFEQAGGDRRVMDEEVLALVIGPDEPRAFLVAEPHVTRPVAIAFPPRRLCAAKRGEALKATTTNAGTTSPGVSPDLPRQRSRPPAEGLLRTSSRPRWRKSGMDCLRSGRSWAIACRWHRR